MSKKKEIHILFDKQHSATDKMIAKQMETILRQGGYQVNRVDESGGESEDGECINRILKENQRTLGDEEKESVEYTPQLLVSVNMAGFRARMSDGSPYLNKLPLNILVYLDRWEDSFGPWFENRMNITTEFLVAKDLIRSEIRSRGVKLHRVELCESLDQDLLRYIDTMDWRF